MLEAPLWDNMHRQTYTLNQDLRPDMLNEKEKGPRGMMGIWSIFHHWQPVKIMKEVKPLNLSTEEAKGKPDFCSSGNTPLSLSLQEGLQGAQTDQWECDIILSQK